MTIFKRFSPKNNDSDALAEISAAFADPVKDDELDNLAPSSDSIERDEDLEPLILQPDMVHSDDSLEPTEETADKTVEIDTLSLYQTETHTPKSKRARSVDEILDDDSYLKALDILRGHSEPQTDIELETDSLQNSLLELDNQTQSDEPSNINTDPKGSEATTDAPSFEDSAVDPISDIDVIASRLESHQKSETELSGTARTVRMNTADMHMDLAKLTADIKTGENLYKQAHKRAQNLSQYVKQAEAEALLVESLETENANLQRANRAHKEKLSVQEQQLGKLSRSNASLQKKYDVASQELEETQSHLAATRDKLSDTETNLTHKSTLYDDTCQSLDRLKTDRDHLQQENRALQDKVRELSEDIQSAKSQSLAAQQRSESLISELAGESDTQNRLKTELIDLQAKLKRAQMDNTEMRTEMTKLRDDLYSYKSQKDASLTQRETELAQVKQTLNALHKELQMKNQLIESHTRDITQMRQERAASLTRQNPSASITTEESPMSAAEKALEQKRKETEALTQKYKDISSTLNADQSKRQVAPNSNPDISPTDMLNNILDTE